MVVNADKAKGTIVFQEIVLRTVIVEREVEEIVNGQAVKRKVQVPETVAVQELVAIKVGAGKVITPDGKQVSNEDLWKRLKKGIVVVVSASSEAPAQMYLRALHAETLVIIPGPKKN
jgi:hypothetical protein